MCKMTILINTTDAYNMSGARQCTQVRVDRSERLQNFALLALSIVMLVAIAWLVNFSLNTVPASESERVYKNLGLAFKNNFSR